MNLRRTMAVMAAGEAGRRVAPVAATGASKAFLNRAIDGSPGFPGARETARKQLFASGDVEDAVKAIIEQHVRLAGVGGFVTQVGGIMALPVTLPANVAGLGAIQLRMSASIAHLRGHDISAPRVRIAAMATLLGEEGVGEAIVNGDLTRTPRDLAFGPPLVDDDLRTRLTATVGQQLLLRVTAKRTTLTLARAVPLIGGTVGAGMDAVYTWRIGRYAADEFSPAMSIERADRLPDVPTDIQL
ncbi:MAG: hypothetical protein WCA82_05340 [Jiangellales bacterium]|jgi:uncharacterized protein (DUF697 family)